MKIIPVLSFAASLFLFSCGGKSYCDCKKEMDAIDAEVAEKGGSNEMSQRLTTWGQECAKTFETASNKEKAECME